MVSQGLGERGGFREVSFNKPLRFGSHIWGEFEVIGMEGGGFRRLASTPNPWEAQPGQQHVETVRHQRKPH